MKKILPALLVCFVSSLAVAPEVLAQRQGFILGAGVGIGGTSFTQEISGNGFSGESERETKVGFATDFKIGYAPSEEFQLYWMSKVNWFTIENLFGDDVTIANGFGGLGVTYYLETVLPALYLTGGLGFSSWGTPFEDDSDTAFGFGVVAGGGLEFTKHLMLDANIMVGQPTDKEEGVEFTTNAFSFKVTLNYLFY